MFLGGGMETRNYRITSDTAEMAAKTALERNASVPDPRLIEVGDGIKAINTQTEFVTYFVLDLGHTLRSVAKEEFDFWTREILTKPQHKPLGLDAALIKILEERTNPP
jgi:hypothetical protein